MHVQRREITTGRERWVLSRRRSRSQRRMIREHAIPGPPPFLVLPQIGLRLSRRFFDCPGMVVLMPGQRRTARERLLAIGVGAFVGSLSGVDAAMSGQ